MTFAPKDVNPVKFRAKDDVHGLGSHGIDVRSVLGGGGHINLFEPMMSAKPAVNTSNARAGSARNKRGMTGTVSELDMRAVCACIKKIVIAHTNN